MARKPLDADGKPLDPKKIYAVLQSYIDPSPSMFVPQLSTRLRGDDPIVQRTPGMWFTADLTSDQISARQYAAHAGNIAC